ncbi:MAG: NAD(P)H-hydrate dehydratase [Endomicrobiaceae bacterium]|nr:NAD(P)H-hydrate dehydratase [Endomicrobiaceae bacterium]
MKIHNIFKRDKTSYKNHYGHVLVVAGSYNMPGAGILCANSAICSGAGLVTFAFPKSAYNAVVRNIKPEIMLLPLDDNNGKISIKAKKSILNFIEDIRVNSVVIGCGVGQNNSIKNIIKNIIKKYEIPVIIDADGLNVFKGQQKNGVIKEFKNAKAKIIVTPHPKEFERISGIKYIQSFPLRKKNAKLFAKNNATICVLKGHKTIVSDGNRVYVNKTGNPGMATAGSGDVLSGIISAFVCNKNDDLMLKVATAVYIHGLAGDIAAKKKTQVSLIASDIIDNISSAVRRIK